MYYYYYYYYYYVFLHVSLDAEETFCFHVVVGRNREEWVPHHLTPLSSVFRPA